MITKTDTAIVRDRGILLSSPALALIKVKGPDAERFLQAQTTNNVVALKAGFCLQNALLDRKAKTVAVFTLYRVQEEGDDEAESFRIIAASELASGILKHLDSFCFADRVEFNQVGPFFAPVLLEGPLSRLVLGDLIEDIGQLRNFDRDVFRFNLDGKELELFKYSLVGEEGFLLHRIDGGNKEEFYELIKQAAEARGLILDPPEEQIESARIEAGILAFGTDYDTDSLLPETNLDQSCVSYEKGCFQGQEVLARVRSHGAPTKALGGILFDCDAAAYEAPAHNTELRVDGELAGWIKSYSRSSMLNADIAIALLKRDFREPGKSYEFQFGSKKKKGSVVILPFYKAPPARSRSQDLYEEALSLFAREEDSESFEDTKPVKLLREAIALSPDFEDAYESLGVLLSRSGRLDEAIEVIKHLAAINPDSIMAHTNLSVFYMEKGWKEKAEEEKAISTTLSMLAFNKAAKEKEALEKEKEARRKETIERLSMFEEVLEIDPDDFLANYGKGSCLVELEQYREAESYLKKALDIKPNHTRAYLELGRAYKAAGDKDRAIATLSQGSAVAARQGDLMPLKDIQLLLHQLES
ncbi:tetratricopeptide repeat protein [bacterium]|nr:tetratricopeptide repeat protein [bacterium]